MSKLVWVVIDNIIKRIEVDEFVGDAVRDAKDIYYDKWFESLDDAVDYIDGRVKVGDIVYVLCNQSIYKWRVDEVHICKYDKGTERAYKMPNGNIYKEVFVNIDDALAQLKIIMERITV